MSVDFKVKLTIADAIGLVEILIPALLEEVGIVSEITVFTGNGSIDLEHTMLVETKSRSKCVWDAVVSAANGVLASDQVTGGKQTNGSQEDRELVNETVRCLHGVGRLSERSDLGLVSNEVSCED